MISSLQHKILLYSLIYTGSVCLFCSFFLCLLVFSLVCFRVQLSVAVWLPGKTHLRNKLLCVEQDVTLLTHSLTLYGQHKVIFNLGCNNGDGYKSGANVNIQHRCSDWFIDKKHHYHHKFSHQSQKTELQKHMTEQKQKAATEAARLNELATHDNVKCHLQ